MTHTKGSIRLPTTFPAIAAADAAGGLTLMRHCGRCSSYSIHPRIKLNMQSSIRHTSSSWSASRSTSRAMFLTSMSSSSFCLRDSFRAAQWIDKKYLSILLYNIYIGARWDVPRLLHHLGCVTPLSLPFRHSAVIGPPFQSEDNRTFDNDTARK